MAKNQSYVSKPAPVWTPQAHLASALMGSLLRSGTVPQQQDPAALATFVCDLAESLYAEVQKRAWAQKRAP